MKRPLVVVDSAIVLDAVDIGLVFPILPALLRDVTHGASVAPTLGAMAALYAAMQLVFAPVLGTLSDRLGRRPVLMISLAGAAVNYLFLAVAPSLWMLFLGRGIAGLTSATTAVATAYIIDIPPRTGGPVASGSSTQCSVWASSWAPCWAGPWATSGCACRSWQRPD